MLFFVKYTLINFRSPNRIQSALTYFQSGSHQDNQHQDKQGKQSGDQQAKG